MPADYIKSLREQYVKNVINAMIVAVLRRNEPEFTRCYALLALLSLSDNKKEARKGFTVQSVFDQASRESYEGSRAGIRAGLKALYAAGLAIENNDLYRLHPRFRIEVLRQAPDIKKAMSATVQD